jgi:hypothetical protein
MTLAAVFESPAGQVVVTSSSGHTYAVTGPTIVINYPDAANVQLPLLQIQGATADRPVFTPQGNIIGVCATSVPLKFFDTTLGEMIFNSNPDQAPTVWLNAAGSQV